MADVKRNQREDTGHVHPFLALGATRSWTKYWLVSEHKLGNQRDSDFTDTPVPLVGCSSQATCPGIFIDLCSWQGSGDRVTPSPGRLCALRELSLCPALRDFPYPKEPALLPPGASHLGFLSFPPQVSWPMLAQQVLLPLALLGQRVSTEPSGAPTLSADRLQRLQGAVP